MNKFDLDKKTNCLQLTESFFWSPPSKTDISRSERLFKIGFKFYRALKADGRMQPDGVLIGFYIFKHGLPNGFTRFKSLAVNCFGLERVEEAFGSGIIVTAALGAHAA